MVFNSRLQLLSKDLPSLLRALTEDISPALVLTVRLVRYVVAFRQTNSVL